jgi:ribosome-associated protein
MPQSEREEPDLLSKTQRKKDMIILQRLGERMATFSDSQLAKMPISDELLALIHTARKLKTHESKRRHAQLIGKRMRSEDIEAIQKALKKID